MCAITFAYCHFPIFVRNKTSVQSSSVSVCLSDSYNLLDLLSNIPTSPVVVLIFLKGKGQKNPNFLFYVALICSSVELTMWYFWCK